MYYYNSKRGFNQFGKVQLTSIVVLFVLQLLLQLNKNQLKSSETAIK